MLVIYLSIGSHDLRKLVRTLLVYEGYEVHDEDDVGATLARLYAEDTPSLVIFGDYLPGMRVEALLTQLQQDPVFMQRHDFLFLYIADHASLPGAFTGATCVTSAFPTHRVACHAPGS